MPTTNNQQKRKTIALVVAGILLASFMGTMGMMSNHQQQTALAAHGNGNTLFYWHSARCSTGATACNDLRDATEDANSGSNQILVFHYGTNSPTTLQRDTMKATTGFLNTQKGYEGISLPQLETLADMAVADFGAGAILGYNLEAHSPDSEEVDPLASYQQAKAIAQAHGLKLLAAPSNSISNTAAADDIAGLAAFYNIQVQGEQDTDTTCDTLKNEAEDIAGFIHATYAHKVIFYQVSLAQPAAEGKTVLETVEDCISAVTPTADLSGASIWWGGIDLDEPSRADSRIEAAWLHSESFGNQ